MEGDKPFELKQVKVRLRLTEGESLYSGRPLITPQAATDVMAKVLAEMDREYCCIVMLDNKLRALAYNVVSIGSINQSIVPMSNIFKAAVLTNASALLAMHNHPSGIADCSLEDMKMTKQLVKAGKLMGIPLVVTQIRSCSKERQPMRQESRQSITITSVRRSKVSPSVEIRLQGLLKMLQRNFHWMTNRRSR